ncbi:MAG TPA: ankyrin repeat domain-containing protein [Candidatus Babeliales bacterium]|nr:ankyrin repeat domain-containing protein [Candidatus Babeliales bacterium]
MKRISIIVFCSLFSHVNAIENKPNIFQEVRNGDKEAIRKRLDNGEDCTAKDENGDTILHIAAREGQEEIITLITEYGDSCNSIWYWACGPTLPTLDELNNNGDTVLHTAIGNDHNDTHDKSRIKIAEYITKKRPQLMEKINKKHLSPAFKAIKKDDPRFIRIFTAQQLNLEKHRYHNGETIFTYAIKNKKPKSIQYCAQKTSLSNIANNDNKTPTQLAIDAENIAVLELLKEHLNDVITDSGIKPIHYAAREGKYQALDYMTKNNISINEPDRYGNPPLFHAIDSNDEQMMNHVLYLGANIQQCNNQGEDALAIATFNRHLHLMDVLTTKHKMNVDTRDDKGRTSFMRASIEQNHQTMEKLRNLGANCRITDEMRENALHKIARNGYQKGAQIILQDDKAALHDKNKDGNTPIMIAVQNGHFLLAQMFLDAGSPHDTINNNGATIIHETVKKNNKPFLFELLKNTPHQFINHKNNEGETPIFFAAQNNDPDTINMLIHHKAEYRTITTKHGLTPIHYAIIADAFEAIKELEKEGASLSIDAPEGNTSAHIAAGHGSIKTLRYLQLSKNGLFDMRNKKGETPFTYGAMQGQLKATELLLTEEYFINGDVSRTLNALKNASTHKNHPVYTFLTQKHNDRLDECKKIHNVYLETNNLIRENNHSIKLLMEDSFLHYFMYSSSQPISATIDDLYLMPTSKRTERFNHYLQCKDKELNDKRNLEAKLNSMRTEQQKVIAQQQADERAKKERIRKQQQDELDRIAEQNRRRAAQEQARLKQELERQNRQTEQERIAAQNGTTVAEQRAALEKIAADKCAADNKRIADEKARVNAEEQEVTEQGECNLCFETTTVASPRCPGCKVGSARTCDACIEAHIATRKAQKLPVTCPFCNKATLSEKLKK